MRKLLILGVLFLAAGLFWVGGEVSAQETVDSQVNINEINEITPFYYPTGINMTPRNILANDPIRGASSPVTGILVLFYK